MLRNMIITTAWIALAFIAYATLSPLDERPELAGFNLFSHFDHHLAYVIVGSLFGFLVVFLCGPSGADISGAALPIDGGWAAS
jgi:hypothetical protein